MRLTLHFDDLGALKLIDKSVKQQHMHFLVNSACCVIFHTFLASANFFQNQPFKNILSGCQTVWIQIRPHKTDARLTWVDKYIAVTKNSIKHNTIIT